MDEMGFGHMFAQLRPAYEIPDDDLVGEVLVPAMRASDLVRIAAGFFSSRCLAQLAPGLAYFINYAERPLEVLVSPEISDEDRYAIQRGTKDATVVLNDAITRLFEDGALSSSAIQRHTVETLAFLVASGRLQMRIVLMQKGMYHKKLWLFRSGEHWLAVHGSGNATERGLLVNGEQMSVDRAWLDGPQSEARVSIFLQQWTKRWENRYPSALTVEAGRALNILRQHARSEPPTVDDFWKAWQRDHELGLELEPSPLYTYTSAPQQLVIPASSVWREGRFAHQGLAVDAILEADGGIVAMATGGGKTRTALIAATKVQDRHADHICLLILVPSRPLLRQWSTEISSFGGQPVVLSGMSRADRAKEFERISLGFMSKTPRTEVVLMTNSLFGQTGSDARRWLEHLAHSVKCLLIVDEVHNFGAKSFLSDLPTFFRWRIGLSATPIRQYDPDGTDKLFDFFGGPPQFEFSLKEAIQSGCLVPYNYYINPVEMNPEEMELYQELTEKLLKAGFRIDDDGRTVGLTSRVEALLRDRRALVEQADAKLDALERCLTEIGPNNVTRTLVYASAKSTPPGKERQITRVNRLLERLNVVAHQYTSEETGSPAARRILDRFGAGEYQALTSMKVLDEGIDIPQTDRAYLLGSSAVEREWVQRRGRILRNAPGKGIAHLHDFVVVPPALGYPASKSLLQTELRRARAFADLADNEFDSDGPNPIIRDLEHQLWEL